MKFLQITYCRKKKHKNFQQEINYAAEYLNEQKFIQKTSPPSFYLPVYKNLISSSFFLSWIPVIFSTYLKIQDSVVIQYAILWLLWLLIKLFITIFSYLCFYIIRRMEQTGVLQLQKEGKNGPKNGLTDWTLCTECE